MNGEFMFAVRPKKLKEHGCFNRAEHEGRGRDTLAHFIIGVDANTEIHYLVSRCGRMLWAHGSICNIWYFRLAYSKLINSSASPWLPPPCSLQNPTKHSFLHATRLTLTSIHWKTCKLSGCDWPENASPCNDPTTGFLWSMNRISADRASVIPGRCSLSLASPPHDAL